MPYSLFLYPIFLFLFMYLFTKKHGIRIVFILCVGFYLVSAIASFFLYNKYSYRYNLSNISYVYFYILLILAFLPIANYNEKRYRFIKPLPIKFINTFNLFLIVIYIPSFISSVPSLISQYSILSNDINYAAELYMETASQGSSQTGSSFANIASVFRGMFSEILVFWSFFYLSLKNRKNNVVILLFLSSLTTFISSFLMGSRTLMSWWLIQNILSFLIFKPFYNIKLRNLIKKCLSLVILFVVLIFLILSFGRFMTNGGDSNDVMDSLLSYLGQSSLHFNTYVLDNDVYQMGDGTLPLFRKILGLEASDNLFARQFYWASKMKIPQGAFFTFLGDMCFDWGIITTFIMLIVYSLFFNSLINGNNRTSQISLIRLFHLFIASSLCCNGLFYLSYKTIGGNLKIITSILFVFLLIYMYRKIK